MPVVYLQNKNKKYIKHNYFVALLIVLLRKQIDSFLFMLDYCDCAKLTIPYGKIKGVDNC